MATNPPRVDGETLRRSRSTGDIPGSSSELPLPERVRIAPNYRYSESHTAAVDRASPSRTVVFDETTIADPSPIGTRVSTSPARRLWSPPPAVAEDVDNDADHVTPAPDDNFFTHTQRDLSWYGRAYAFFGYGRGASRARRALVSLIWNLGWGLVQVVVIVTMLVLARSISSPTHPSMNQWDACGRPLGLWCCFWVVRVFLACALSYWGFFRDRKARAQEDVEGVNTSDTNNRGPGNSSQRQPGNPYWASIPASQPTPSTAAQTHVDESALPHGNIYARMTLFSSLMTLTWFLTAHILEYTSINTCRHSSPYLWWLTFAILCIMYVMVLEVVFLGLVVFIIAPILFVFWNIILICIGRHPLQNPTMIKPDIGKLPKTLVERIPLVIYIPPPPDEPSKGPITVPDAVYSYPPTISPPKRTRRRFAFLRRLKSNDKTKSTTSWDKARGTNTEKSEPQTWEDHWEQGDYPFVRLEGNRAACAICLIDFEEPKRISAQPTEMAAVQEKSGVDEEEADNGQVQEIPIDRLVNEDETHLRLTDAGEGAQPLRLLTCGHVFHQTCLDPWLTGVSGRCPVCQRPVHVPLPVKRKKTSRRRNR